MINKRKDKNHRYQNQGMTGIDEENDNVFDAANRRMLP
eukprot:CAMPEP_0176359402 /NCGR_PEP_ID=MMETSP0126-20121128/16327_1 /TAXON_ID=141414 ORGANISM="Strombidinopsis acuminatum, Strain SPMC142" /NCGR_SAMPLE_ID=MMETSP0126 /ASSEMBLY_ACC=CAM_ASM_000229 /LENGTH=37 /DNA_ID= /DNA_START= /DNA_END= /DNA_ORIENTATION=